MLDRSVQAWPAGLWDRALRGWRGLCLMAAVSSGRAPAPAGYRVLYPVEEPGGFRLLVLEMGGVRKRAWLVCHFLPSVMTPI